MKKKKTIFDRVRDDLNEVMSLSLEVYAGADCGKTKTEHTAHQIFADTKKMYNEFVILMMNQYAYESYLNIKKLISSVKKSVDFLNIEKLNDSFELLVKDMNEMKHGIKACWIKYEEDF